MDQMEMLTNNQKPPNQVKIPLIADTKAFDFLPSLTETPLTHQVFSTQVTYSSSTVRGNLGQVALHGLAQLPGRDVEPYG